MTLVLLILENICTASAALFSSSHNNMRPPQRLAATAHLSFLAHVFSFNTQHCFQPMSEYNYLKIEISDAC